MRDILSKLESLRWRLQVLSSRNKSYVFDIFLQFLFFFFLLRYFCNCRKSKSKRDSRIVETEISRLVVQISTCISRRGAREIGLFTFCERLLKQTGR